MRLLPLLRPHLKWVILGVFLSLLTVVANVGLLALSSWFVASMAVAGVTGVAFNYTLPAAGVRALALTRTGGRYLERLVNHNTTLKVLSELRVWLYRRIEPVAPARLSEYRSGDLLSRLRADVDTLDDFYVRGLLPAIVALLSSAGYFAFLLHFSPGVALVDIALLAAAGVLLPAAVAAAASCAGKALIESAAALRTAVVEHTEGLGELIAFAAVDDHEQKIRELSRDHDGHQRRLSRVWAVSDAVMVLCVTGALWLSLLVTIPLVAAGALNGQSMAMLLVFVVGSFEPVMVLPEAARRFGEIAAASRRVFALVDAEPPLLDAKTNDPAVTSAAFGAPYGGPEGAASPSRADIRIRNLRFRYAADTVWALDGIDFDLPQGRKIAIVGATGAGKSSVANVLLRFWEYQVGTIELSGVDLREIGSDAVRTRLSFAPQNPHLFHTSIRENLVLGDPTAGDDQIAAALATAQVIDLVGRLTNGLDTDVGEAGGMLSAGQRRRIAIARALLKPAPVLILDEPTEGLDGQTAKRMMAALFSSAHGRSIVIITHLLFGIDGVDEVICLDRGRIVAQGPPGGAAVTGYIASRAAGIM